MKRPLKSRKFPFIVNENHIYNRLIDNGIEFVDCGWAKFTFQLHSNLKFGKHKVDGLTEFSDRSIKLEMSLIDEEARETIIHEIMHCILEGCGIDERNYPSNQILTTNEVLANVVAKGLALIHRLNPGLINIIYE